MSIIVEYIIDTNILYKFAGTNQADQNDSRKVLEKKNLFVSDISIMEWILRKAQPKSQNLNVMKKVISLVVHNKIKIESNRFAALDKNFIQEFVDINEGQDYGDIYNKLLNKRIEIEAEWMSFSLAILLGALTSHLASKAIETAIDKTEKIHKISHGCLNRKISDIQSAVKNALTIGYDSGRPLQEVKSAVTDLSIDFLLEIKNDLYSILGDNTTKEIRRDFDKKFTFKNFQKEVGRYAKDTHINSYISDFKKFFMLTEEDSKILIDSIMHTINKVIVDGRKIELNNINDSFVVSQMPLRNRSLLTFDARCKEMVAAIGLRAEQL